MEKGFYLTTPIYYVNDLPTIGHAYTTIAADAVARYQRQRGREVCFLTGTDEHGINVERAARAHGTEPARYANQISAAFEELWRTLNISHDRFIRTTEAAHTPGALELWRRLQASGDIYRGVYAGPYCPRCEAYYAEDELVEENCPVHAMPCDVVEEENFFFRLSRYQDALERLVQDSDFVQPETRRNEVLGMLRRGLRDFSVTRRNVRWGIPVPEPPDEVLYVWVDALASYLSGVGFPDDLARFERSWPADVHLIGKEITRFHCLYWPAMLWSAGLPLPRRVFAHGWLTKDGRKIAKSTGNMVDAAALAAEFGVDAVRFWLLRGVPFGQDGDFTRAAFVARYNADLANDFGNLVQRATTLISRYSGGRLPAPGAPDDPEKRLRAEADALSGRITAALERLAIDQAIGAVMAFVSAANRYAEETAPWRLARDGEAQRLATSLYHLCEAARLAAWHLSPFIPTSAAEAHRRLCGQEPDGGLGSFGAAPSGAPVQSGPPLFPRQAH